MLVMCKTDSVMCYTVWLTISCAAVSMIAFVLTMSLQQTTITV